MKLQAGILSAVATLALIGAPAGMLLAQQKPAAPATKAAKSQTAAAKAAAVDHTAQGSVVSMTDQSLVIRSKGKDMTLALKPDTQKLGDIATGKQVTVHYRDENKVHLATSVQEAKKAAAPTKAKK